MLQTLTESVRYAIIQAEERAKGAEGKCTTARTCHRVTPERAESCPYCDKFDRLRPAEEADECRLTELDALNASVMESLLKEANVPYIARPMMGAGISAALGVTLEKFVFFVAYRDYARAQEQLEALLAPDDHAADADFADEDEESEDEDE